MESIESTLERLELAEDILTDLDDCADGGGKSEQDDSKPISKDACDDLLQDIHNSLLLAIPLVSL
jgi:hypothetical protein